MNIFKTLFGMALISSTLLATTRAQEWLTNGLAAYYPFHGNANDETGNGNNGEVHGAILAVDRFGRTNHAFSFDGSSYPETNIKLTNSLTTFNFGGDFTISAWINFSGGTENPRVFSTVGYGMGIEAGDLLRRVNFKTFTFSGIIDVYSTNSFAGGTWLHVVSRLHGNSRSIFVDGVLEGEVTAFDLPYYYREEFPEIGGTCVNPHDSFCGYIDDVRIYNRALSDDEVQRLYRLESQPEPRIMQSPSSQSVLLGSDSEFIVAGNGSAPISYQWLKDAAPIACATNSNLTFTNCQLIDSGFYSVVLSNVYGSVTSAPALLRVVTNTFELGMVAYYPLNENANDMEGTNHGTAFDANYTVDRYGSNNAAILLNGYSSYVGVPYSSDFDFPPDGQFTLSTWFKINGWGSGSGGIGSLIVKGLGGEWDYGLEAPSFEQMRLWAGLSYQYPCMSTNELNVGVWYHGLVTYSNATWNLYENGVLVAHTNTSYTITRSQGGIAIGRKGDSSGDYFNGAIDEVRIYNRALTDDEVQRLYMFEASPCIPHPAIATATVVDGSVTGVQLTDMGCGYTNAPIILIRGGGGTGALAQTTVNNGFVTGISLIDGGVGYTNAPRVKIASPPFMPSVNIAVSRVKVSQHVMLGHYYVLESSPDLSTWNPVGTRFMAEDELIEQEFEVSETGRFFRVREVP